MTPAYLVGITGGPGCGKSVATKFLRSKGFYVIDADEIAHQLFIDSQDVRSFYIDTFGTLDRSIIRGVVFSCPEKRTLLDHFLHPRIESVIDADIAQIDHQSKVIFVVIPLLFEVAWDRKFDEIWAIICDGEVQLKRIMHRDQLSQQQAQIMIKTQLANSEKAGRAHHVIDNSGSLMDLQQKLLVLLENLENRRIVHQPRA